MTTTNDIEELFNKCYLDGYILGRETDESRMLFISTKTEQYVLKAREILESERVGVVHEFAKYCVNQFGGREVVITPILFRMFVDEFLAKQESGEEV